MKTHTKTLLVIAIVGICIFALNWALADAFSGPGFYFFATVNGLIFAAIIFLAFKKFS